MTEPQPEAVQPPHYQQAPYYQQPQQQAPHYQQAQQAPHYGQVTDEQRRIWETKGKRGIGFGVAWFLGGLLITLITYSNATGPSGGVYVVAWGPMLYGAYRLVSGFLMLNKSRQ